MMTPNRELAVNLAKELLDFTDGLRGTVCTQDPEGRTLSLGVTMFFGAFMAAVKEWEDRETMAGAALGYSVTTAVAKARTLNTDDHHGATEPQA